MLYDTLKGKRIAILATDGVERIELTDPRRALESQGAQTDLIAPKRGRIKTWEGPADQWGGSLDVDLSVADARAGDYHALLLPGGIMNQDLLRQDPGAVALVRAIVGAGKKVAAICHGLWLLIEVDAVRGRRVTSWPSLRTDLVNAGAWCVDDDVVVDGGLVTSRGPDDLPAFCARMVEAFASQPKPALVA